MSDISLSSRAEGVVNYIRTAVHPFARIDAVASAGGRDLVDITLEPELVQDRVVAICNEEPVRLSFPRDDLDAPRITSLRGDFPLDLVHTNLDPDKNGRCLCVWEEGWDDLCRTLTPQALIERIRDWFSRTARGELHPEEQGLEPLLAASVHTLIIPPGPPAGTLYVIHADKHDGRWTVMVSPTPANGTLARFAICSLVLPPAVHGALREHPRDLQALAGLIGQFGGNLVEHLCEWVLLDENRLEGASRHLLLLVWIPKCRVEGGEVESHELWAFASDASVAALGDKLGRTFHTPGEESLTKRIPAGEVEDLSAFKLDGWRVVQRLDRVAARAYSGNPAASDVTLVAVGAGAIGSHIVMNTTRAGIGHWTIIDDDIVLPHNTVRQTQPDAAVGYPKAEVLAAMAGTAIGEPSVAAIRANYLAPGDRAAEIDDATASADTVLDLSASPAVLGRISDNAAGKRAGSVFFNPDGVDAVMLIEDRERSIRLDELEAQYFLGATGDALSGHLSSARLDRLRYANACQDLTRPVPPWQVQTLAAIAGGILLKAATEPAQVAQVWQLDRGTGGVVPFSLLTTPVHRFSFGGFRITITAGVCDRMAALRRGAAPNETGGILIGSVDAARRVVHIVDALPAPPDSRQSPTYFIRGARHLKPQLEQITARSGGALTYLGEWHSHPDGAAARPSVDDEKVFAYLKEQLEPTGAPYVMAIRGAAEVWFRAGWNGSYAEEGVAGDGG